MKEIWSQQLCMCAGAANLDMSRRNVSDVECASPYRFQTAQQTISMYATIAEKLKGSLASKTSLKLEICTTGPDMLI